MVVRMRVNRSKVGRRRSHHALKTKVLSRDTAGNVFQDHRVNPTTGMYKGRQVIDVKKRSVRLARRNKRHEKELKAAGKK